MNDFFTFASSHGLAIDPTRLCASDRIQRCGTKEKPLQKNGAFFWDGERGWVWNWSGESRVQWFSDLRSKPWTEEDKAQWMAKRQAVSAEREASCQAAALRAAEMIRVAKPDIHGYLTLKGFPALQGLVADDGALLIPMRNLNTDSLQGVQVIRWDGDSRKWEKKMTAGMRARGAVFRMGSRSAPETFLCEGYATGLSVATALRSAGMRTCVVVCFSAYNMEVIASQIRGRAFVFADNDDSKTGERAAQSTGYPYVMSDVVGEDANDLHLRVGLFAVVQKVMEARRR